MTPVLRTLQVLLLLASLCLCRHADARPPPVVAPAGHGQMALSVWVDDSAVRLQVCAAAPCAPTSPRALEVPPEARRRLASATLVVVPLYGGRHAVHVRVPDAKAGASWEAVVAGPLGAGEPKVVFQGFTGLLDGQPGERRGPIVWISDRTTKGRRIVVGTQREDIDLCGREAVLAPSVLRSSDLTLRRSKVHRLRASERVKAPVIQAVPVQAGVTGVRLNATAASSAIGAPQALTDGRLETSWSEDRSGAGRGEFVRMSASPDVAIRSIRFVARPTAGAPEKGVAAKEFWIATDDQLYRVVVDGDAWAEAGAWFEASLPAPVKTACVGLVTESASSSDRDVAVTFAELELVTDFDVSTAAAAVAALSSPSREQSQSAMAALKSGGALAYGAVVDGFAALDDSGRSLALEILADAPCDVALPAYLTVMLGTDAESVTRAVERVRRCGPEIADAFASEFRRRPFAERRRLATPFAAAAPARAVEVLSSMMAQGRRDTRAAFRDAIGGAARQSGARQAVLDVLSRTDLAPRARLDVLRALGAETAEFLPASAAAFDAVSSGASDFPTRYLALEVAARLERVHAPARAILLGAFADPNPHLRLRAAQVAPRLEQYEGALATAARDEHVRVREAAAERLGALRASRQLGVLLDLVDDDAWPLVRASAVRAVGELGPSGDADEALVAALADDSPLVRRPVLFALAQRNARSALEAVRDRLDDGEEDAHVRAAAATALATLCDYESVDQLTEYAESMTTLTGTESERIVARASLAALGRLQPKDLEARLTPFFGKDVPRASAAAARSALSRGPSHCARGGRRGK